MANAGDIRLWLAEQGFGKYAEVFSSNAIDLDVVRELTEADLKDARGTGADRGSDRAQDSRFATNPRRHCDRLRLHAEVYHQM
jgi:hypothetical protein